MSDAPESPVDPSALTDTAQTHTVQTETAETATLDPEVPPSGDHAAGGGSSGHDTAGGRPPGDDGPTHRRLHRDMEHRMLGGVAAGLARYLDVDVVIVRVAMVALAILGGAGVLLYLAAWLLIPAGDDSQPLAQQWAERRPRRRSLAVIVIGLILGIIALSDLFSSGPWWPHRDGGVGLVLGAVALGLAVVLVAGSSGGNRTAASRLRWLLVTMLLAFLAVIVVVAATVFSIEAMSGVPLRGGIGDTQWHPTSAAQVRPEYRLAMGNLTVDLSDVTFRPGTTHVTVSVGVGRLVVSVPQGPVVSVDAHSGLGDVEVFGRHNSGLSTVQVMQSAGTGATASSSTATTSATGSTATPARIVLDADAGVGQVEVIRTAPTYG